MASRDVPMSSADQIKSIHTRVQARLHARAHTNGMRNAAAEAFEALEVFLRNPTRDGLATFAAKERAWAQFALGRTKCYAEELKQPLRQGEVHWKPTAINSNYNKQFNPYSGFIYGLWSIKKPYRIKLGMTTRHPTDRVNELKERHSLDHLEILFFYEVGRPRDIEHELHKRIGTYLKVDHENDSREWFEMEPPHALQTVLDVVKDLNARRFPTKYVHKHFGDWPRIHHWHNNRN